MRVGELKTSNQKKAATLPIPPAPSRLTPVERLYFGSLQKLYAELLRAQEQDFDAHLRDGLEWCVAVRARILESTGATNNRTSGILITTPTILPAVAQTSFGDANVQALLERLHRHRGSGHRGKAIDRDLAQATVHAEETRAHWREMQVIAAKPDKGMALEKLQLKYLEAVMKLLAELEKEGEPDFDGLLRNAINFLMNDGRRVCF